MARRSAVQSGPVKTAREGRAGDDAVPPLDDAGGADSWDMSDGRRGRGAKGRRWGGSGGRWWLWIGRAILWAFLIVVLVNGVRAPFERFTADESGTPEAPRVTGTGTQFPTAAASSYALQFANVYLNYDERTADVREQQLRAFLPDGADGQLGWNRAGQLQVQSVQVAGVEARDANNAIVMLLARAGDKWLQLAVPVYARNGALVISGRPALLPPPGRATPPQPPNRERDTALEGELQTTLGPFFQAYSRSDQPSLDRFAERPGITGLGNTVTFIAVKEVIAPQGGADERKITATVTWQIPATDARNPSGELDQTYELTVVKKDGNWYVRDIRGAVPPTGS
ncbi:conjugal transfer protein [Actinomadura craniellae]|uniref:Conjugal transfer protein n=1 Tax=Actinomadura craniellae TaxID=2231787 RepID=A0A365H5M3_9ACTN|nr:conjugal transfer protein [Actinomadura craniellae]RAY14395.1 conjugal transfer protein [Actinomadura craniellae]